MPDSLRDIGLRWGTDKAVNHSYLPEYEADLPRYQPITLCELGVLHGQSVAMWLEYGGDWRVIGVDASEIKPLPDSAGQPELTKALTSGRFTFFQCPVHESRAANLLRPECCDVIVDDADHDPAHQIDALENFWPALKPWGYWFTEDVYSSRTLVWLNEWARKHDAGWRVVANFVDGRGIYRDDDLLVILRKPA